MTLAETLTASTLLTLVMGLTLSTVQPGLSVYGQDQAQGNLDQLAMVVARQFSSELETGSSDSLSVGPQSLSFLRYQGYDARSGQPIWDHYRVWWQNPSDNTVHASDLNSPRYPSLSAYPATPAELALPYSSDRVVMRGATGWQASQSNGAVSLNVTLQDGSASSQCQACVRMRL